MLLLFKTAKVLVYLILLFADLFLWFIVTREMMGRNRVAGFAVLLVKAIVSAILLFLFFKIIFYHGEFADPANAFRQIQMGTMAVFLISAATTTMAFCIITWLVSVIRSRKFAGTGIGGTVIFLLMIMLMADGYFRQRLDIRTLREEVTIEGLDPALDGVKIALISDIHISSWHGSYKRLDRAMESAGREKPDLVLNTGDFITFGWQEFGSSDTILRKAEAAVAAFAVEGNHDDGSYHPGYDEDYRTECSNVLRQKIEASGYNLLRDTAMKVPLRGTEIAVAGIVTRGHRLDMNYGDFEKVLSGVPDTVFTILLLHDPAGWLMSSVAGKMPALTVSGHTHGFQAGLPGIGWSPSGLIQERWKGLHEFRGSWLYVSTGIGTMGMAARFFMPPEIVILTIKAG